MIDGETYYVAYLPVSQALNMGDSIMKAVAPALEGAKGDTELSVGFVASALTRADGQKIVQLLGQMMKQIDVTTEDKTLSLGVLWEKHFQGRLDVLVSVVRFFLETQYGSFSKLLEGFAGSK